MSVEEQAVTDIGPSCSAEPIKPSKDERELRKRAMKLDLGPILGKAFRYVVVNKKGECEEVDEQFVRKRRESFLQSSSNDSSSKKSPMMKKVRKPRPACSNSDGAWNLEPHQGDSSSRPEWLPEAFTITRVTNTHLSGWVNSEEELAQVLTNHSAAFSCKFMSWYRGRGLGNTMDPKRISWKREDIAPGCPFAIDNYLVRHCPYGMRLKRLTDVRDTYREVEKPGTDKDTITCHARLKIRRVTLYDDFKLNPEERTKKMMWEKMMRVKQLVNNGQQVQTSSRIYLQLPLPAAHRNHVVSPGDGVKTEALCPDRVADEECIETLFEVDEGAISFDGLLPKLEVKETDETSQSAAGAFQVVTLPFDDVATNNDQWKVEGSVYVDDAVPTDWTHNGHVIKEVDPKRIRETEGIHFEVRPPYKRTHILSSCKVDCPARLKVKRVSLYESFKLDPGDSRRKKDDKMMMVKDLISNSPGDLQATSAIFLQLPLAAAHRNHQVSLPSGVHSEAIQTCEDNESSQQFLLQQQQQLCGWLPPSFHVTACGLEYLTGWVTTEEDYLEVMDAHRHAFNCSFLSWSNDKERTYKAEADRRVMWRKDFVDPGCPLTVHHSLILSCAYSYQSKGSSQEQAEPVDVTEMSLVPEPGMVQVTPDLAQTESSLEIQYCDVQAQYSQSDLQALSSNDTFIIYVENS